MKTALSPERLAVLHAEGHAKTGRFVDPGSIFRVKRILQERGEDWAASVLLRDLSARSRLESRFPALRSGEETILVLADEAEWAQLAGSAGLT
ncbi:hypothetical protein JF729_07110 [Mycobacterium intracellulare]|uniref:hypothetical protein n=1 Tax=Mycobacterium intracellulare TaxID=1767 RepID=UPI001CD9CAF7|nr:hypothetical protein [Mycobacterium intracellulare]MCA2247565.1 hypothetical protein [Mycobacterium intracellulare]